MVMVTSALLPLVNGNIDINKWLQNIEATYNTREVSDIRSTCAFVQSDFEDVITPIKISCLSYGLEIANILLSLKLDAESIIAALLYPVLQYSELTIDDLQEHYPKSVIKLLQGTLQMDNFGKIQQSDSAGKQIDNYRRMLLSMVDDTRVVLLKLAERTVFMRHIRKLSPQQQEYFGHRVMDIYAPLANRLGILDIKWELEDLSFQALQPQEYKKIAKQLRERRIDRENFVNDFMKKLDDMLKAAEVNAEITGRAKHIYSIYRKMTRKEVGYEEIYDAIALRILVDSIEDCYQALSIVHAAWEHVPHEFDDYIATPKANGYQSIHTVITPEGRNVEIQIRTHQMHADNELGGAAHWMYKEGGSSEIDYQNKISWLRQLLDWQREVADLSDIPEEISQGLNEDRVYVFTPEGIVVSLPKGATPLDFAYYIHTEIGHKCRGAKINDRMVPLTYQLKLGDRVDILTGKEANPSRDWLNPQQGYLISPRAKAKIHNWFKKRDYEKNVTEGQNIYQRELKRLNLSALDPETFAKRFHLNNGDDVLAAIGAGDIRMPQLTGALQDQLKKLEAEQEETSPEQFILKPKKQRKTPKGILVSGVNDLLTTIGHCCKPLPGEPIVGFITMGRGITVHRKNCNNLLDAEKNHPERVVEVSWGDVSSQHYAIDLVIEAHNRPNLLRDITKMLSEEKINLLGLNSYVDKQQAHSYINISLEIAGHDQLTTVQNRLQSIEDVISIRRQ
jgi:GTP pyrophosphokinase